MIATRKSTPSCNTSNPMVKRTSPDWPSIPMLATIRPTKSEARPRNNLPSARVTAAVMANRIRANISDGPNFRAKLAASCAIRTTITQAIMPPMKEAIAEVASAAPARPFCAIR